MFRNSLEVMLGVFVHVPVSWLAISDAVLKPSRACPALEYLAREVSRKPENCASGVCPALGYLARTVSKFAKITKMRSDLSCVICPATIVIRAWEYADVR